MYVRTYVIGKDRILFTFKNNVLSLVQICKYNTEEWQILDGPKVPTEDKVVLLAINTLT